MARSERKKARAPWYAAGLSFRCTACGACCTGEPGHVWVEDHEVRAMAKVRALSPRAFRKAYVRRVGRRESLKERENGDCVMLEGGRCTVYEAKPLRCTTFPFWKPVLESPEEWDATAVRCEGIGQGDHYSLEEIEQLLAGDQTPLVEKHKRPPEHPVISRSAQQEDEGVVAIDWDGAFAALEQLYRELDAELPRYRFTCSASGRCCDFDAYGHRLYVSTLEARYFFDKLGDERINDDPDACPAWGADRLCKERVGRMLGCRTYFCGPYATEGPEALHERYLAKVNQLHDRFRIPYEYKDVRAWAEERLPAQRGHGE
jgi:Fe-S-cluster containining protein